MDAVIKVPIFVESRYKVDRRKIKQTVWKVIKKQEMVGPVEVSIAIVGDRKMKYLNKKYRGKDETTDVLSFSQLDSDLIGVGDRFSHTPDALLLGDVVISYPTVIKEAARYNELVDERICMLVEHGVKHLLGEHHE